MIAIFFCCYVTHQFIDSCILSNHFILLRDKVDSGPILDGGNKNGIGRLFSVLFTITQLRIEPICLHTNMNDLNESLSNQFDHFQHHPLILAMDQDKINKQIVFQALWSVQLHHSNWQPGEIIHVGIPQEYPCHLVWFPNPLHTHSDISSHNFHNGGPWLNLISILI